MEKLVRDLLDRRIPPDEIRLETDPDRLASALQAKLGEETDELARSGYRDLEEFADVLEVLLALAGRAGFSAADVEARRLAKRAEKGGFERGLMYQPKD